MSLCRAFLFTHGECGGVRTGLGVVGTADVARLGARREKKGKKLFLNTRRSVIPTHSIKVLTRLIHIACGVGVVLGVVMFDLCNVIMLFGGQAPAEWLVFNLRGSHVN